MDGKKNTYNFRTFCGDACIKENNSLIIRHAALGDMHDIVTIHLLAFPGFFLTSMGSSFLRLLYRGFISEPGGICLVAQRNNRIIGMVAGTFEPNQFFKNLLRSQWFAFALASIPGLLKNPLCVSRKCLGALFYRGEAPPTVSGAALLSSLAVLPSNSGGGVGKLLVSTFAEEARKKRCCGIYLTTDRAENEVVNRFYAQCGLELLDSFQRPGKRIMNRWILQLPKNNTSSL